MHLQNNREYTMCPRWRACNSHPTRTCMRARTHTNTHTLIYKALMHWRKQDSSKRCHKHLGLRGSGSPA